MGKKKISAKQILEDLTAGMGDDDLRRKHGLSEQGIEAIFKKMIDAGLLTQADLDRRAWEPELEMDVDEAPTFKQDPKDGRRWFDRTILVIALLIVFWPIGLYALFRNRGLRWKTKGVIMLLVLGCVGVFVAANAFLRDSREKPATNSSQVSSNPSSGVKAPEPQSFQEKLRASQEVQRKNMIDIRLWEAASDGDIEGIRAAMKAGANVNCCADTANGPPLKRAAFGRHPQAVKLLLDLGAQVNLPCKQTGQTPLHAATSPPVDDRSLETVRILIDAGADIDARTTEPAMGDHTPWAGPYMVPKFVFRACKPMRMLLLEYRLKKGPLKEWALKNAGWTDKHSLSDKTMLKGFWDVLDYTFSDRASSGDLDEIRAAIAAGADIDTNYRSAGTPLSQAAYFHKVAAVRLLLELGANPNRQMSRNGQDGQTALHKAAKSGLQPEAQEVAQLLLDHGADMTIKDNKGLTPLDVAFQYRGMNKASREFYDLLVSYSKR